VGAWRRKKAVTFLKKSNQKTFAPLRAALAGPAPREAAQKFFCALFKKALLS
jgi:hypothetical protein